MEQVILKVIDELWNKSLLIDLTDFWQTYEQTKLHRRGVDKI